MSLFRSPQFRCRRSFACAAGATALPEAGVQILKDTRPLSRQEAQVERLDVVGVRDEPFSTSLVEYAIRCAVEVHAKIGALRCGLTAGGPQPASQRPIGSGRASAPSGDDERRGRRDTWARPGCHAFTSARRARDGGIGSRSALPVSARVEGVTDWPPVRQSSPSPTSLASRFAAVAPQAPVLRRLGAYRRGA